MLASKGNTGDFFVPIMELNFEMTTGWLICLQPGKLR